MTEADVINIILRDRWAKSFCLPRYTPSKWWECDVFEVTKSGYFREYEVKLTLADFKADAKKERRPYMTYNQQTMDWDVPALESKHGLLGAENYRGPSRFWYVTPARLIPREMLPTWAGLIEIEPSHARDWREREAVPAPVLHRSKIDSAVMDHARGICYYRMHRLMNKRSTKSMPELGV